jgi:hypothetical protein
MNVPEAEMHVPEQLTFPLFESKQSALKQMALTAELPQVQRLELPFDEEPPAIAPERQQRRTYITMERVMRLGATPGCKSCKHWSNRGHLQECIERFERLMTAERNDAKSRLGNKDKTKAIEDNTSTPSSSSSSTSSKVVVQGGAAMTKPRTEFCNECLDRVYACVCIPCDAKVNDMSNVRQVKKVKTKTRQENNLVCGNKINSQCNAELSTCPASCAGCVFFTHMIKW